MKKLHNSQVISKLVVAKLLRTITLLMRNFIANFVRILGICKDDLPHLIRRRQFNARRKLTVRLAEEIRKDVAIAIDGTEDVFCIDSKPVKVCQNARAKRCAMGRDNVESAPDWGTIFSQLNDNLMMIRNYAKQSCSLFTRMAGKIAAMTFMQYVNFINHRPIGQIKYSLI